MMGRRGESGYARSCWMRRCDRCHRLYRDDGRCLYAPRDGSGAGARPRHCHAAPYPHPDGGLDKCHADPERRRVSDRYPLARPDPGPPPPSAASLQRRNNQRRQWRYATPTRGHRYPYPVSGPAISDGAISDTDELRSATSRVTAVHANAATTDANRDADTFDPVVGHPNPTAAPTPARHSCGAAATQRRLNNKGPAVLLALWVYRTATVLARNRAPGW